MKKVKIALLMLLAFILILPACKKGANDPFISLKSRDGKITATWKLTKIAGTQVQNFGTPVTTTFSYDGTFYSETYSTGGNTSATGTFEMTLDKDGIVTWSENYTETGFAADVTSGTSYWQWIDSDKNKNFIYIDAGNNFYIGGLYVDRLVSKELIMKNTGQYTNNGTISSMDVTYTFEKQ